MKKLDKSEFARERRSEELSAGEVVNRINIVTTCVDSSISFVTLCHPQQDLFPAPGKLLSAICTPDNFRTHAATTTSTHRLNANG